MKSISNMKIGSKLAVGLGGNLLVLMVLSGLSFWVSAQWSASPMTP